VEQEPARQEFMFDFLNQIYLIKQAMFNALLSVHFFMHLLRFNLQLPSHYDIPSTKVRDKIRSARLALPSKTKSFAEELTATLFFKHFSAKPCMEKLEFESFDNLLQQTPYQFEAMRRQFKGEALALNLCGKFLPLIFVKDETSKISHSDMLEWVNQILAAENDSPARTIIQRSSLGFYRILKLISEIFEFSVACANKLPLCKLKDDTLFQKSDGLKRAQLPTRNAPDLFF
jgi:hypothetical protein